MAARKFEIIGKVIDSNTQAGISSLKVEAWDKDVKYDDFVGVGFTGRDGSFDIKFDQTYFREFARDDFPDLYFKVYRREVLLKSTEDSVIVNAGEREEVLITLDLYHSQTEVKDRISYTQTLNVYSFIRQSDFKGLKREAKNKTSSGLNFIRDMITGSLNEIKPVRVSGVKEENIVGRDTNTVQASLSSKNIAVANILPYDPKLNSDSLKQLSGYPVRLKPGQQVNLYEKDGKVRYYSVVKEPAGSEDLQSIRDQLNTTKAQVNEKDKKIEELQNELVTLRKEQETIRQQMDTDSVNNLKTEFEAMKKQLAVLSAGTKAESTTTKPTTKTRSPGTGTSEESGNK